MLIFHREDPDFRVPAAPKIVELVNEAGYRRVAYINNDLLAGMETDAALDTGYCLTNNTDHAWVDNPQVETFDNTDPTARSTSVGDLITFKGRLFVVAHVGFIETVIEDHDDIHCGNFFDD